MIVVMFITSTNILFKGNVSLLKGDNYHNCFLPPSEKGSTLKGKNLLPLEANSLLFEKTPFQKGTGAMETKQEVTTVVSLVNCGGESTKCTIILLECSELLFISFLLIASCIFPYTDIYIKMIKIVCILTALPYNLDY